MNAFYGAYAGAAFTLLGLWWVALEVGRRQWISHPERRRVAGHVTFSLLITGFMSLISLVEGPAVLWRASFVIGGAMGLVNVVALYRSRDSFLSHVVPRWMVAAATTLYVAVVVVAFLPAQLLAADPAAAEPGVTARLVGAVMFALLLMVIAWIAWSMFAYDTRDVETSGGAAAGGD